MDFADYMYLNINNKTLHIHSKQWNITYLHLLKAFCRLLKGSVVCCWLGSTSSGGGEARPGGTGVVGVLVGVGTPVGVAPPELGTPGVALPSPSPMLHRNCLISPWPSWLRSLRLHRAQTLPGLRWKILNVINYFKIIFYTVYPVTVPKTFNLLKRKKKSDKHFRILQWFKGLFIQISSIYLFYKT